MLLLLTKIVATDTGISCVVTNIQIMLSDNYVLMDLLIRTWGFNIIYFTIGTVEIWI